jgi:RNase P subunit RPR2
MARGGKYMIRGCIAVEDTICDGCHQTIHYPKRYLITDEDDKVMRFCVECAKEKGYAHYLEEKDGKALTFLPEVELM